MLRGKLELYKRELETAEFQNGIRRHNQAYTVATNMTREISSSSMATSAFPFGETVILGVSYEHFNTDGSMLDQQFVKTARVIENLYPKVLKTK